MLFLRPQASNDEISALQSDMFFYHSPDHRQLVTDVRFAAKLLQPPIVAAAIMRW